MDRSGLECQNTRNENILPGYSGMCSRCNSTSTGSGIEMSRKLALYEQRIMEMLHTDRDGLLIAGLCFGICFGVSFLVTLKLMGV